MNVLIATDHIFMRHSAVVYDTYAFDYGFFRDYLATFPRATVLCRMNHADRKSLPHGASRSDGEGLKFAGIRPCRRATWFVAARLLAARRLQRVMADVNAVVVRVPSELGWLAARAAVRHGKPYMVELVSDPEAAFLNSGDSPGYRLLAGLWAGRTRRLVRHAAVVSYVNGTVLPSKYPASPGTPWDVVSSIRLSQADLSGPRTFTDFRRPIRLVHVGTLTPRKRIQDLLEACRLLRQQGTRAELHIVGDGPERSRLTDMAERLGLEGAVHFHGHLAGRSALHAVLDYADLFLLASASEGLPRAVIEAMGRGLPVVAANSPGIEELVDDDELFAVGDTRMLVARVEQLARMPNRLTALSHSNVQKSGCFRSEVLSPKRAALYGSLAAYAACIAIPASQQARPPAHPNPI